MVIFHRYRLACADSSLHRYTLEPNETSNSLPRTYTLRSSSQSPSPAEGDASPSSSDAVLATTLDETDILFSTGGFRYRVKSPNDGEDMAMSGPGDLSDLCRVSRWKYALDSTSIAIKSPTAKASKSLEVAA